MTLRLFDCRYQARVARDVVPERPPLSRSKGTGLNFQAQKPNFSAFCKNQLFDTRGNRIKKFRLYIYPPEPRSG